MAGGGPRIPAARQTRPNARNVTTMLACDGGRPQRYRGEDSGERARGGRCYVGRGPWLSPVLNGSRGCLRSCSSAPCERALASPGGTISPLRNRGCQADRGIQGDRRQPTGPCTRFDMGFRRGRDDVSTPRRSLLYRWGVSAARIPRIDVGGRTWRGARAAEGARLERV
jgi:hypothetical protein